MPTRDEMIKALQAARQSGPQPTAPSREQMLEALQREKAGTWKPGTWLDQDYGPTLPFVGHMPLHPRGLIQATARSLPIAGAMIGGGLGAAGTFGAGALPLAAAGGASGKVLQNLIEQKVLNEPKTGTELMLGPASGAVDGVTQELSGMALSKALEPVGAALYKSGLKNLDKVGARYGKEPVSDLLMENNIWGSAKSIQKQMDDLADQLLLEKKGILQKATASGAEVDMNAAVKRAQDVVDKMRYIDNPEQRDAVASLQRRIDTYKGMNAKNAEDVVRELPFTKEQKILTSQPELPVYQTNETPVKHEYDLSGRTDTPGKSTGTGYYTPSPQAAAMANTQYVPDENPLTTMKRLRARGPNDNATLDVINNPADVLASLPQSMKEETVLSPEVARVFDQSERVPGPNPIQTDAWKTTGASKLGDPAFKELAQSTEGKQFQKALNGGMRDATEKSVADYLGADEGQALAARNEKLGKILTSQERAQMDAEMEASKNAVTPVDAMAFWGLGPGGAALKKAADISKMTSFRTGAGLGLKKAAQTRFPGYLAAPLVTQDPNDDISKRASPWIEMMKDQYEY
jgi:hypothetical protein